MPGKLLHSIGRAATRIRFNSITPVEIQGARYWAKQRRPGASLLVTVGNAYARAIRLPLRMLAEALWLEYQPRAITELLDGKAPLRRGNQLLLPHAHGVALTTLLANSGTGPTQEAVALASRALARLHQQSIRHPLTGCQQPFSHADATPGNVVVDLEQRTATWLDFETVHPPDMPAPARHADDLRTFLCGLAPLAAPEELPALIRAALAAYGDATVLTALRELLAGWHHRPRARRLAMPDPTDAQWACLVEAAGAEPRM